MGIKVMSVSVYCYGIKRRGRKAQRHSFEVAEFPADTFDEGTAVRDAVNKISVEMRELHPKSRVTVSILPMVIAQDNGFTSRSFGLLDAKRLDITASFAHLMQVAGAS